MISFQFIPVFNIKNKWKTLKLIIIAILFIILNVRVTNTIHRVEGTTNIIRNGNNIRDTS